MRLFARGNLGLLGGKPFGLKLSGARGGLFFLLGFQGRGFALALLLARELQRFGFLLGAKGFRLKPRFFLGLPLGLCLGFGLNARLLARLGFGLAFGGVLGSFGLRLGFSLAFFGQLLGALDIFSGLSACALAAASSASLSSLDFSPKARFKNPPFFFSLAIKSKSRSSSHYRSP